MRYSSTEEKEFRDIYSMDVVEVPTNKPIARIDHNDAVFKQEKKNIMQLSKKLLSHMKRTACTCWYNQY